MKQYHVRRLTQVALLTALSIVLSRFCSISTPIVKIGFSYLPIVIIAVLHGPFYAAAGFALADLIGATLFPVGAYFPGFTLTALLSGAVYGAMLYNRPKSLLRCIAAVLLVSVALNLGLNTLWLMIITGKGYLALFPARVLKCVVTVPLETAVVWTVAVRLQRGEYAAGQAPLWRGVPRR